ncbi:MAG: DUF3592 domain-containing protein [Bacteroidetes bacterium]|nr:MAG: DUF3592 domain-containing protein [Bacteroidota bacterium]
MPYAPLSPPPRQIPLLDRLTIIVGGTYAFFGWAFYGMGMMFFAIFGLNSEIIHWFEFGDWDETPGVIVGEYDTNASENDSPVMRYTFRYAVAGDTLEGQAYVTGSYMGTGQQVIVEYRPDNPQTARIPGTRREMFGWGVVFVIIFPLIGLGFLFFALRRNLKAVDLLVNGSFAQGKLESKAPTSTKVNEQTVYRYTFSFVAPETGQTYQVETRTHQRHLVEDEETERLLYAPSDPSHAVIYDTIPNAPAIQPDGALAPLSPRRHLALIIPGLVLLSHILYLMFKLG